MRVQMFFMTMSLVLIGVKYKSDKRDKYLHHGNYMLKLALWLLFTALPFLFPNSVIEAYSEYCLPISLTGNVKNLLLC